MGIYSFKWEVLRKYLVADENDPNAENDFGKNVIPAMLADGQKLFAYEFEGYWKDVGTISSLWEANMETLGLNPAFNLYGDGVAKIYARNYALPASYIDTKSKNVNCLIAEGCEVYGDITHSVISTGCKIGRNAMIEDSVIMPNVVIEDGVIIRNAIIGEDCKVCSGAVIGGSFREGEKRQISVVGKNHVIAANQVVKPGEVI
jgi:glucose-1-phosphate adenylyltransferase